MQEDTQSHDMDSESAAPESGESGVAFDPLAPEALKALAVAGAVFFAACLYYAVLAHMRISRAYVDFGDGNYLYIASRIADGLVPYRDIMAPQPPAHLMAGAWILSLGEWVALEHHLIRWFSIFLRLATALLVGWIAVRAARSVMGGAVAAAVYLFLPNGFIWSLGYQSEPLEILFLTAAVCLILPSKPWTLAAASLFGALSIFTNMTAVPYMGLTSLWLIWRLGWRSMYFVAPLTLWVAVGVAAMEGWTGHYLENVFFNQVGTYPSGGLFAYAFGKLASEGRDILFLEGWAVALSLLGIAAYWRTGSGPAREREFLTLYALASLGSIVFVSKGGTMEYIFTIGEPYVAVFFAYAIVWICGAGIKWAGARPDDKGVALAARAGAAAVAAGALALFAFQSAKVLSIALDGGATQLSEERVAQVRRVIKDYTEPRQAILTPPYFAYESRRRVVEEYSEIFIWNIGYLVEQDFGRRNRKALDVDGPFTRKALKLARLLEQQKIPLVILDVEQTGQIPEIKLPLYGSRRFPLFELEDFHDVDGLARKLRESPDPLSQYIRDGMSPETRQTLFAFGGDSSLLKGLAPKLVEVANRALGDPQMYQPERFDHAPLSTITLDMAKHLGGLLDSGLESRSEAGDVYEVYEAYMRVYRYDVLFLNRRLIAEAYGDYITLHRPEKRYRQLNALIYHTQDTPLRFFVPLKPGQNPEPMGATLDDLYPLVSMPSPSLERTGYMP